MERWKIRNAKGDDCKTIMISGTDHDQLDREKATAWGVVMTFLNNAGHITRHRGYKAVRRDCSQS